MTNTITIVSDYHASGDIFIASLSYYDKFAVAYKDVDGSYIAADKSMVDDYVHQQWLCSGHYAQVDDLCWQEFCTGEWVLGHRAEVRKYIKEHQIKENEMKECWNGVKHVYRKGDLIFLDQRIRGAYFNDVVNTLYTYCFDDAGVEVADSDEGFREWCASHPETVRAVVERFTEYREEGYKESKQEETKLSDNTECPRLASSRTVATIELEPGVTLDTQFDLDLDEDSSYKIAAVMTNESFRTLCSMHDPTVALAVIDAQIRGAFEKFFGICIDQSCRDVHINSVGQLWFKYTTPADTSKWSINTDK